MLSHSEFITLQQAISQIAQEQVQHYYRQLQPQQIEAKTSPIDLVTIVDKNIEQRLHEWLLTHYPQACIIGEEQVAAEPQILDQLDRAELAFVIDPIDGTWNFANGLSVFGVMVAIVERGKTVQALLYDPLMNDWWWASHSEGAYQRNAQGISKPLCAADDKSIAELTGFISPFTFPEPYKSKLLPHFGDFARVMSFGCSCYEYRLLTAGRSDFLVSVNPKVWDHAPGQLILAQAGGYSAFSDGEPYTPSRHSGVLIAAASKKMWQQLVEQLELK